jgi:cytochrome P450
MAEAATMVAERWRDSDEVDLDAEARRLTMWALGRSILGTNLDGRADALAEPLRTALSHIADRGTRPVKAPRWLPPRGCRRARPANATMHHLAYDILEACRADPTRDAPLVHVLLGATDPETGRALSRRGITRHLSIVVNTQHGGRPQAAADCSGRG